VPQSVLLCRLTLPQQSRRPEQTEYRTFSIAGWEKGHHRGRHRVWKSSGGSCGNVFVVNPGRDLIGVISPLDVLRHLQE
jgi:hypothetical protein